MTDTSPDTLFESALREALEKSIVRDSSRVPANLAESIRYSLLSPGKRIRPRLALECGKMLGLPQAATLPVAVALEMVHAFTLIHDDLPCMDNSDTRRGQPSNHKKFGEAVALLAGDGLMAMALDVFAEASRHVRGDAFAAGLRTMIFALGPHGVIGGQAAEMLLAKQSPLQELLGVHERKTASLFYAAVMVPKDFAGIENDSQQGKAIAGFGRELGIAFQVADDFADEDKSGKTAPLPTSILYYMPKVKAAANIMKRLTTASGDLRLAYGDASKALLDITDEVKRALIA